MKCKACNADFEPHMRVLKDTGQRILEDLCSTCRRYVYSRVRLNEDSASEVIRSIVDTRRGLSHEDGS